MTPKIANTDLPLYSFCIELLLGSKYGGATLGKRAIGVFADSMLPILKTLLATTTND
jgi:hypothetical protein